MQRNVDIFFRAKDEVSKTVDRIASNSLPNLAKSVATAAAGFFTLQQGAAVLRSAFEEALKAEATSKRLAAAIRDQGNAVETMLPRLKKQAEALALVSVATDEDIQDAQRLLISLGGLAGGGLDRATKAALNLSAALDIPLADAAEKIARAAQGSSRAFKQLGFQFEEGADKGQVFETVLSTIEDRMGGAAQAKIESTAGKWAMLVKRWGEAKEALGGFLLNSAGAGEFLDRLTKMFDNLAERGPEIAKRVKDSADPIQALLLEMLAAAASGKLEQSTADQISASDDPFGIARLEEELPGIERRLAEKEKEAAAKREEARKKRLEEEVEFWHLLLQVQEDLRERLAEGSDPSAALAKGLSKGGAQYQRALEAAAEIDSITAKQDWRDRQMDALESLERPISSVEEGMLRLAEVARLVRDGIVEWTPALQESYLILQKNVTKMDSLGSSVQNALGDEAQGYAMRFGDTLVDAAMGAEVAWDEFFKQLIADMIKAIIKALILRMIAGSEMGGSSESNGSWFASAVPGGETVQAMERGGRAPVYAAGGLMLPRGFDTLPAMLKPGELVIPSHAAKQVASGEAAIVSSRGGGGLGASHVHNWYVMDGPSVRDFIRRNAREFEAGLEYLAARRS